MKEIYEKLKNIVNNTTEDLDKFADNGNKAAGTRVRNAMQEVKKLAQELRVAIQEAKNVEK